MTIAWKAPAAIRDFSFLFLPHGSRGSFHGKCLWFVPDNITFHANLQGLNKVFYDGVFCGLMKMGGLY